MSTDVIGGFLLGVMVGVVGVVVVFIETAKSSTDEDDPW